MRKRMGWIQAPVLSVLILGLMTAGHADDYGMGEGAPTAAQEIRHGHLNGIVWARQWIDSFSTDGFELGALMDMYADDVQFEDVIFSCDSKAELTKYFAASELPEQENILSPLRAMSAMPARGSLNGRGMPSIWESSLAFRQKAKKRQSKVSQF